MLDHVRGVCFMRCVICILIRLSDPICALAGLLVFNANGVGSSPLANKSGFELLTAVSVMLVTIR